MWFFFRINSVFWLFSCSAPIPDDTESLTTDHPMIEPKDVIENIIIRPTHLDRDGENKKARNDRFLDPWSWAGMTYSFVLEISPSFSFFLSFSAITTVPENETTLNTTNVEFINETIITPVHVVPTGKVTAKRKQKIWKNHDCNRIMRWCAVWICCGLLIHFAASDYFLTDSSFIQSWMKFGNKLFYHQHFLKS